MNQLTVIAPTHLPALVAASGDRASWRFREFFTAAIRNPNTRRAYARDVRGFLAWCTDAGIASIVHVNTMHVAAYIEQLGKAHPAPTVKRHLADRPPRPPHARSRSEGPAFARGNRRLGSRSVSHYPGPVHHHCLSLFSFRLTDCLNELARSSSCLRRPAT